ncbi:hypothetical protein G3H63_16480 [Microbacterium resistens]|uniref:hypothetical protein n=1 Tax=Microbacterium resistens TaxID=156977 RepID=UPI001C5678F3|nr:hypothetical protein [Microbacterium resistens]MBW1640661.1 hypothetical protein [Microbacterium resistens]
MMVTVSLPLALGLPVGRVVAFEAEGAGGPRILRDVVTGIRYVLPAGVLPDADTVPGQARVDSCTVIAGETGVRTELVLDPVPVPDASRRTGTAAALSGAEQAAASATGEAVWWGGGERTPREEPERFW